MYKRSICAPLSVFRMQSLAGKLENAVLGFLVRYPVIPNPIKPFYSFHGKIFILSNKNFYFQRQEFALKCKTMTES